MNISGSFIFKGFAALIQLALLPAYMRFFGEQAILGVWFTIISLLGWIFLFDIGIGNGLRNKLAFSLARDDKESAKIYITSAYISLGIFSCVIAIVSIAIVPILDWNAIFNIADNVLEHNLLVETVAIVLFGIIIKFFLNLISGIFYAMQLSVAINIMAVMQNLVLLIFLFIVTPGDTGQNLRVLAWANVVCMNLPSVIATFVIFSTRLKEVRPNLRFFKFEYAKDILGLSLLIFIIQILGLFISQIEIFITLIFSSADVVEFQVYNKLFGIVTTFIILAVCPLWSAVTKAMAQNRYVWILKLYKLSLLMITVASFLMFAIIPFLNPLFKFWLGENAPVMQPDNAVIMALFNIANIWGTTWCTLANGMNILKPQIIALGASALLKIPLTYALSNVVTQWNAVALAYVLLTIPNVVVVIIIIYRQLKYKIKSTEDDKCKGTGTNGL